MKPETLQTCADAYCAVHPMVNVGALAKALEVYDAIKGYWNPVGIAPECESSLMGLVKLSNPLLFETEEKGERFMRLGYYDGTTGHFYQAGDDPRRPYRNTVIRWLLIPMPS